MANQHNDFWDTENDIVNFLVENNDVLESILKTKIKLVEREFIIPRGMPRKTQNNARIDLLVTDIEDRVHIIEVKHPKDELLKNSSGIAQLLFYDAMFWEKEGKNPASLTLVTSQFDNVLKEIVPRNNLKVRIVEAKSSREFNVVVGYEYKPGRPKEYKDYFVDDVYKYVIKCAQVKDEVRLPTVEELATDLGFSKETLYQWAKEKKDFSDALEFLKDKQCVSLINNGLASRYNSTIAKLVLSANHGMREKTDMTTNDKDLPIPIINVSRNDSIQEDKQP